MCVDVDMCVCQQQLEGGGVERRRRNIFLNDMEKDGDKFPTK